MHDKAFNVISGIEDFTGEGQMKKESVWREHDPIHSTFTGQYRIPGPMPGSEQVEDIVRLRNATVKSITMN